MLNTHNLLILKKYRDSRFTDTYTNKIFKMFIPDLYYNFNQFLYADNYEKLFVRIFITNFIEYLRE